MIRVVISVFLAIGFSSQSLAGGSVTAKIVAIRIDWNGFGMVYFDQPLGGTPASCGISPYATALAFDSNTPGGKAIMAMALAAKATGDTVIASGSGACSLYGSSSVEDWAYGVVQ